MKNSFNVKYLENGDRYHDGGQWKLNMKPTLGYRFVP